MSIRTSSFLAASVARAGRRVHRGMVPMSGAGPSFRPDVRFTGSTLAGWHTLGDADWRAQDGEIVGTPKATGRRLARAGPLVPGRRILRIVPVHRRLQDRLALPSRENHRRG